MSWKGSEEVLFHDASAYFSEEEWRLLQDWQKELYRNVMKEIHQALISLGPLIAATVCTLRTKDNNEPQPLEEEPPERRHERNHWPTDTEAKADDPFSVNKEEERQQSTSPMQRRRERSDCGRAGFPSIDLDAPLKKEEDKSGAIFIDHLGVEVGESSSEPSSAYEVVSVCIKDEAEIYCVDSEDSKRKEPIVSPTGNESMERKRKSGGHLKFSRKSTLCTSFPEHINTVVRQSSDEEADSRRKLWSDCYRQLREENSAQCGSSFSNPLHLVLQQGHLEPGGSDNYNAFQDNHRKSQLLSVLQSTPHYQKTNLPTDNHTNSLKEKFTRPFRTNSRERPYTCTECGKSFFQKSCLVTHYRIHSSEKPYLCTFCPKRFNRKDYLDGHIRIHTGERPYKCMKCDKSFVWKSHLNNHQKKHT